MFSILTSPRIRESWPAAAAALIALALQACGGSGSSAAPAPMPTVAMSVSPASITAGQSATLMWSSTQAASCTASGAWSGGQAAMGSKAVTPATPGSMMYTLTCTGASGGTYGGGGGLTATQTTTLTVNSPTTFVVKALVADGAGVAATEDANLRNGWGLVFDANEPVWISNNGTNTSSLYDGNGANEKLLVSLPASIVGTPFQPTGIVSFDPTNFPNDFVVTSAGKSGPSSFIYSGLDGQIAGWNGTVDSTHAVSAYSASDKACYRGLAIANNGTANFLYANDFLGGKIDVFDAKFTKQSPTAFPFTDPKLPKNYAPFGIQAIANGPNGSTRIYVSYAMSGSGANKGTCEDTRGAGFGTIEVFDPNGKLVTGELVPVGGLLNAPWGMALAPKDFGTLSNALLVSNHADGKIHGYDPVKGTYIGTLQTDTGAFAQDGLWGIAFGNDGADLHQPHNTLFFTAGPNKAANGLYGRIDLSSSDANPPPNPPPTPYNPPPTPY
jgi:uncharacterized protein (TIGR03118 family)